MNLRRITAIMKKDITSGMGRTFFILALVVPVLMTLIINLIFGKLFSEKPTLAVVDEGRSKVISKIKELDSVIIEEVEDKQDLKKKVKDGAIDGGIIIPKYFDRDLNENKLPRVDIYIGGESLASNRMVLASSLAEILREESGQKLPIKITEIPLGESAELPIKVKIIPLIVMYAIFIGGTTLPSALIVDEVSKRTISAVATTPASLGELIAAKAIIGFLTSFAMGLSILIMNQIFTGNIWLLILFMALGALFSVELGITIGGFSKDMTTAWTYVKLVGFFAFMPVILGFFPQVPDWISQIFPTYYLIEPILDITQHSARFADVWLDALILFIFILFFLIFAFFGERKIASRA